MWCVIKFNVKMQTSVSYYTHFRLPEALTHTYTHKASNVTIKTIGPLHWRFRHKIRIRPILCWLAIYHLCFSFSQISPISLSLLISSLFHQVPLSLSFMKSAYVLRGILLSPDTNLHKVHAIIGSREANYFPGNITFSFFYYVLIFKTVQARAC